MDLIALKQEVENKNKKQNSTQKEDNFLEKSQFRGFTFFSFYRRMGT